MTRFIGPRPGWEDHGSGTIRIEVDWETWANSDRPKHTDPAEQGAWLADAIARQLQHDPVFDLGPDVAIHELRYYGPVKPTKNPTTIYDIGRLSAP
jgi:hypothetical protein